VVSLGYPLNALAIDGRGTIWVAGADGHLRAFDAAGEPLAEIAAAEVPLVSLALAPDSGRLAAGATDGLVSILDLDGPALTAAIPTGDAPAWSLAFDVVTCALMAGGPDNVVRGWDATTGAPLGSRPVAMTDTLGESRGADVFRACAACHTLTPDDGHRAGPTLHGLFGRRIATADGFEYSEALRSMDIVWTPETVSKLFDLGPAAHTPGTRMPEQRIPNSGDRDALIDFLRERTGG
jgi:cytochrome c